MIVSDVMTRKVLSVAPEETVEHAANLMLRHGISGLFVVDAKGTLCGVVTEGDLLRRDEIGTVPGGCACWSRPANRRWISPARMGARSAT